MQSHSDKFSRWEIHNIMKTSDIEQIDQDEKNSLSRSSIPATQIRMETMVCFFTS